MKYIFYPSLFTFFLSSTNLSAAEIDDEAMSISTPPASLLCSTDKFLEEDETKEATSTRPTILAWAAPYYKQKYSFSDPTCNISEVCNAAMHGTIKQEQLLSILEEEARKENSEAQERLYFFRLHKLPSIDLFDESKATALLERSLEQEQLWAFWAKAQQDEKGTVTKWHCLAANRGHEKAIAYVNQNLKYTTEDAKDFLKELRNENNKRKCKRIKKEFEQRWVELSYARPFLDVLDLLNDGQNKKIKELKKEVKKELKQRGYEVSDGQLRIKNILDLLNDGQNKMTKAYQSIDKQKYQQFAADFGDLNSVQMLIDSFQHGKDYSRIFQYAMKGVTLGSEEAMYNAGVLLAERFEGQKPDKKRALELFLRAAEKGHVEAMYRAGLLLGEGFGWQAPDKKRAFELYLKAAEKGLARAMCGAGVLLGEGFEGQAPNLHKAFSFLSQAAEKEITFAMVILGKYYLGIYSEDVVDIEKALFWLEKAKALGEPLAGEYLQKAQQYGESEDLSETEEDDQELLDLLEKSSHPPRNMEHLQPPLTKEVEAPIETSSTSSKEESSSNDEESDQQDQSSTLTEKQLENTDEHKQMEHLQPTLTKEVEAPIETSSTSSEEESSSDDEDRDQQDQNSMLIEKQLEKTDEHKQEVVTKADSQKVIRNPKYLRAQLRQAYYKKQERDAELQNPEKKELSENSKSVVDSIMKKDSENLSYNDLDKLFKDPFYCGQVIMDETNKGICVVAHNRRTNKHCSTGTHRKHTKKYKGLHPAFVSELPNILELF